MEEREIGTAENGACDSGAPEKSRAKLWLENFIYHYKWHSIVAAVLIVIIIFSSVQMCTKPKYDVYFMYAGNTDLKMTRGSADKSEYEELFLALKRHVGDKNKDGEKTMEQIAIYFKNFLYPIAEISAGILELVGIIIIIIGSCRALIRLLKCVFEKKNFHVVVDLGKALSLALEFKMGAEIIKTVIIHNLEELAILGIVIVIRALLSVIIHWEMRMEEKNEAKEAEKK